MEAPFEDVRVTVETVDDHTDRRGVHGYVRQIPCDKEPAADERGDLAEAVFRERELAAGLRIFRDHVRVACGNDDHDESAEDHRDRRAGDAGIGKEFLAGVDEASPSYDTSERDRPDVHRSQLTAKCHLFALQGGVCIFHFYLLFLSLKTFKSLVYFTSL